MSKAVKLRKFVLMLDLMDHVIFATLQLLTADHEQGF